MCTFIEAFCLWRMPIRQLLDPFKLEDLADDNFKMGENGKRFSKRVVNTVGKGEIARYEQFLLFPQCFKRLILQTRESKGLFGTGLNVFILYNCETSSYNLYLSLPVL